MLDIHQLENGCAIVGDGDLAIRGDHDFVEPARPERRLQGLRHNLGSEDVRLLCLEPCEDGRSYYSTRSMGMYQPRRVPGTDQRWALRSVHRVVHVRGSAERACAAVWNGPQKRGWWHGGQTMLLPYPAAAACCPGHG